MLEVASQRSSNIIYENTHVHWECIFSVIILTQLNELNAHLTGISSNSIKLHIPGRGKGINITTQLPRN